MTLAPCTGRPASPRQPVSRAECAAGTPPSCALASSRGRLALPRGRGGLGTRTRRHSVGQMPIHHAQKWGSGYRRTEADIHKGYLDMPSTPLFSFGHGLSYTTFAYNPLKLEKDTVDVGGEAKVS
jgi:beta-xylosidase